MGSAFTKHDPVVNSALESLTSLHVKFCTLRAEAAELMARAYDIEASAWECSTDTDYAGLPAHYRNRADAQRNLQQQLLTWATLGPASHMPLGHHERDGHGRMGRES